MKISELKAGQGKVDIEITIKSKADIRVLEKYGKELKIANAVAQDDSGEIAITLWNDDAEKVNVGDKIKITNGYVSEYNGAKQLTSGKFGKLEVVSSSKKPEENASPPDESKPEPEKADKADKPAAKQKPSKPKKSFDEDVAF